MTSPGQNHQLKPKFLLFPEGLWGALIFIGLVKHVSMPGRLQARIRGYDSIQMFHEYDMPVSKYVRGFQSPSGFFRSICAQFQGAVETSTNLGWPKMNGGSCLERVALSAPIIQKRGSIFPN